MIIIILIVVVVLVAAIMFFLLKSGDSGTNQGVSNLLSQQKQTSASEIQEIKEKTGRSVVGKKRKIDIETKKFRAGFYTDKDFAALRFKFMLYRIAPIIILAFLGNMVGGMFLGLAVVPKLTFTIVCGVLGGVMGVYMPESVLDDTITKRYEETIYHLPMVIEELTIGISSGLDMGPCISYIVEMATKRRSHNVVTEMFVHVEKLVQAGYSLSEALLEVAEAFGQKELTHTFMFLAQVAKQGGEVSKQLQDLGEAVTLHRQVQIESQIVKLPVKATGPLAMVFGGFFIMLLGSVFVALFKNFGDALN